MAMLAIAKGLPPVSRVALEVRRDWLPAARIARLALLKLPPVRLAGRGAVFVHLEATVA